MPLHSSRHVPLAISRMSLADLAALLVGCPLSPVLTMG